MALGLPSLDDAPGGGGLIEADDSNDDEPEAIGAATSGIEALGFDTGSDSDSDDSGSSQPDDPTDTEAVEAATSGASALGLIGSDSDSSDSGSDSSGSSEPDDPTETEAVEAASSGIEALGYDTDDSGSSDSGSDSGGLITDTSVDESSGSESSGSDSGGATSTSTSESSVDSDADIDGSEWDIGDIGEITNSRLGDTIDNSTTSISRSVSESIERVTEITDIEDSYNGEDQTKILVAAAVAIGLGYLYWRG